MDRHGYWILKDKVPVQIDDIEEWAKYFEKSKRIVKQEDIKEGVKVSTVFLGLDHRYGEGTPLLFETMIFGGEHDQYQDRCSTYDEALEMHAKAVNLVNGIE